MGVPGTGTAVWWKQIDPTLVLIPMVATMEKKTDLLKLQVNPDIPVALKYEDYLNGQDKQLERAVEEMLKPLNNYILEDYFLYQKKKEVAQKNYLFLSIPYD
jgi:C-terminal processing protease CtpA/Prc